MGGQAVEHRIHKAEWQGGNMGAQFNVMRAFCSCGWVGPRTSDPVDYKRGVDEHLESA